MYTDSEDIPSEVGNTLYIAHPFTTTHSAHHQAFKPIEPWNNIVHSAIDSYTGFILSQTYDKHQWLLLQFIILLMAVAYRGGVFKPPRNSEDIGGVLDRVSKKNRRLDFLL